MRLWLEGAQLPDVLGIKRSEAQWSMTIWTGLAAERLADGMSADAWQRLSAGNGAKGPRLSDWARVSSAWRREKGAPGPNAGELLPLTVP